MNSIKQNEFGCILFIDTLLDNPSIISQKTKVEYSKLLLAGEPKLKIDGKPMGGLKNNANLWIYETPKYYEEDGRHLNFAIESILDVLDMHEDEFLEVFNLYSKYHLLCYCYFFENNPYFIFKKGLISRLEKYKIEIEFDMYCLPED